MAPGPLGAQAVDAVFEAMSVDSEWSIRLPDGFRWWPYRLAQDVRAKGPTNDNGFEITKVTVSTEVVRDVPDDPKTYALLAAANRYATLYTAVYDPSDRVIRFVATVYLHQGNMWYLTFLKVLTGLQAAEAERSAEDLALLVKGSMADSECPNRGKRGEPDGMLGVGEQVFIPRGQRASPFVGAFPAVEKIQPNPWVLATSSPTGITAEFNFVDVSKKGAPRQLGGDIVTAVIMADSEQKHPRFGSGVLFRLGLPLNFGAPESQQRLANQLNLMESTGTHQAPLMGSWCVLDDLWYVMFIPAVLGDAYPQAQHPQLLSSLMTTFVARSNMVRDLAQQH